MAERSSTAPRRQQQNLETEQKGTERIPLRTTCITTILEGESKQQCHPKESTPGEPSEETARRRRVRARSVDIVVHGARLNRPATHEADTEEGHINGTNQRWTRRPYGGCGRSTSRRQGGSHPSDQALTAATRRPAWTETLHGAHGRTQSKKWPRWRAPPGHAHPPNERAAHPTQAPRQAGR